MSKFDRFENRAEVFFPRDDYNIEIKKSIFDFGQEKMDIWEAEHRLFSVHFEVTPKCNFRCVHCYLQKHHSDSELTLQEIVRILDELYDQGVLFITFTGGEVFSRPDFMNIYAYAKHKGFVIEIFTNGMLINENIVSYFSSYPPLLVDISLYGASEATYRRVTGISGAFERVVENCKKLIAANIRVALKSPMMTLTMPEINDMKKLANEMGITFRASFEIIPGIDGDKATQQYQLTNKEILLYEFNEAVKHRESRVMSDSFQESGKESIDGLKSMRPLFRCKIGAGSCVIDYAGNVFPCMKFRHIGKCLKDFSLSNIWEDFKKFQNAQASKSYKCLSCAAFRYCELCPAEMDFLYGDAERIDMIHCQLAHTRKAFYESGLSIQDAMAQYEDWAVHIKNILEVK